MKKIVALILIFLLAWPADGQIIDDFGGTAIVVFGINPVNTLDFTARSHSDTPYKGNTLNINASEKLVVNLREYDCATFVETMLAIALGADATDDRRDRYVLNEQFRLKLTQLRYHGGVIKGYASRIHYFMDWLREAQTNGILDDVTQELGGVAMDKTIDYMTQHSDKYPRITSQSVLDSLKNYERILNATPKFYIPKERVAAIERQLQDGDVVGITSSIAGLDCNHQGIVVRNGKRAYLLHASSEHKKVLLSSEPLADYLRRISIHTGIIVARLRPGRRQFMQR